MNLIDGSTFTMALIKRAKSRFNQKNQFTRDIKRRRWEIAINNGWNKKIVHILRDKCDGYVILKGNFLSRLSKYVGLAHERVKTNLKYQEPEFYSRFLKTQQTDPLKSLIYVQINI